MGKGTHFLKLKRGFPHKNVDVEKKRVVESVILFVDVGKVTEVFENKVN